MSTVKEIWDRGAALLDAIYASNVPYHSSHAVIADLLPKDRPTEILDLGAGTGLLAERILSAIPRSRVTCLDFSPAMIEQAKRRLGQFEGRASFVCDDMMAWHATTQYDAVVACNALVYKGIDLGGCYRKYGQALKSGGLILNSTVVTTEDLSDLAQLIDNMRPADRPPLPKAVLDFAATTGRAVSHFGPGSLAFAVTIEEHLDFMLEAGLMASCPWRYLTQAILAGVKRPYAVPSGGGA